MNIRIAVCTGLLTLASATANAADWFVGVSGVVPRLEPWSDGTIWLARPISNQSAVSISGQSSSCLISQIHLIPPAGQEKSWLATLLAAMTAGKTVSVYGECVASNSRIDATRLVIE